jgi:hypothetical protein
MTIRGYEPVLRLRWFPLSRRALRTEQGLVAAGGRRKNP